MADHARGPGRPSLDDDPARRARNFRWFLAATLGYAPAAIAAGEPIRVHRRTVARGVAQARAEVKQKVGTAGLDFAPSDHLLAIKNATTRRRTKPRQPGDAA